MHAAWCSIPGRQATPSTQNPEPYTGSCGPPPVSRDSDVGQDGQAPLTWRAAHSAAAASVEGGMAASVATMRQSGSSAMARLALGCGRSCSTSDTRT